MEFDPLKKGKHAMFDTRFIRVEDKLYMNDPDNESLEHPDLAREHDLNGVIRRLTLENPANLDAGIVSVNIRSKTNGTIIFGGRSRKLDLPVPEVKSEARQHTFEIAEQLYPNYTILTD